jgi:hypothetical protein
MRVAIIGLCLLLSSGVATAHAQPPEYGLKAGVTSATLVVDGADPEAGYRRRISPGGGGFVALPVAGPLALQIEALFTPKGAKLPEESGASATFLLDYLEFPLLGRITVFHSSSRAFHVFGGPSAAIRVNAKLKIAQSGGGFTSGVSEDISSQVKRFDLGLIAGAGVNAGRHLVIDARYGWGLSDINRSDEDGAGLRTRTLSVLAGFRF